jgi:hypothetical protein
MVQIQTVKVSDINYYRYFREKNKLEHSHLIYSLEMEN